MRFSHEHSCAGNFVNPPSHQFSPKKTIKVSLRKLDKKTTKASVTCDNRLFWLRTYVSFSSFSYDLGTRLSNTPWGLEGVKQHFFQCSLKLLFCNWSGSKHFPAFPIAYTSYPVPFTALWNRHNIFLPCFLIVAWNFLSIKLLQILLTSRKYPGPEQSPVFRSGFHCRVGDCLLPTSLLCPGSTWIFKVTRQIWLLY